MGNKDSTPRNDIQDITHEKSTSECHISDKSTLSCNKITKVENGIGDKEESVKKAIKLAHASSCAVQTHKLPGETKESFDILSNSETSLESIQLEAANLANVNSDFIFNDKLNATSNDDMEKNTIAIENKLPEESVNMPMQSIDIYSDALAYLPIDEIKKMVNFPTVCDRPLKTMQSEAKHIPDKSHSDPLTLTLVPTEAVETNVIASDEILDIANNIYLSPLLPSCCKTCPESSRNLGDEHCNLINPQHTVSINVTEATNDSNANTQFSDIDETTSVGNEMTCVYSNASDLSKYPLPQECNPDIFENGSNIFALIVSTDVFCNKNEQLKELSNNITETPVDSNINTQPDNMKEAINIVEKATELTSTTADLLQYALPQEVKSACQESIVLASMISTEDVPCNRSDELQQLFNNATGTPSDSSINIQPDNITEETVSNAEEFMEVTETDNLLECSSSHKIKSESQENITLTPNSARDLSCCHSDEPQLTVGVTDATCGSNLNIQSSNSVEGTSNVVNKLTEATIAADLFGHSLFQELKSDLNENQVTVSSTVSSEDFPCKKNEIQQPHITINSDSESCLSVNHNTKQEGSSILIVDEKELAFDYSEDLLRASENVLQNAGYRELSPSSEAEAKQIALQMNEDFLKFCNITELNRSPVLNNHSSTDPDVPVCCEEKSGHTPEITVVKKELFPYMLNDNAKPEIQEREIQNDINLFNGQTSISIENKTSQSSSEVVHDLLLPNCAAALSDKGSDELQILENAFDIEPGFNTCSKLKMEMSGMERECIQQIQDPLERCLCTEIATVPQEALSTRTTNSSTEFPITASTQSDLESGLSHDTNCMAKDDFNCMTDDSVPQSFSSENNGANSVGDFCGSVESSSAFHFLMKEDKSVSICPSQGRPSVISRFYPLVSGPGLTRIQNVKSLQPSIEFENSSNEITFECVDSTPSQVNKNLTEEEFQNALKCHKLQHEQSLIQLEKEHVNSISIIKHDIDCLLQHNVSLTDACDIMRNSINEGINFADAEFIKQKSCQIDAAIHRKNLIIERDQALEDLRNVEKAFSDLMTRYNNAKVALEQMKENQLVLKQKVETGMKENNEKQEKYNALHLQVDEKLNIINEDLIKFQKDHEAEKAAVTAMLRKSEIRVRSLTTTLNQTEKDKYELLRICEDFGYKKTM